MIPRPFHRWKSFWFGLLVIAFLSWAWARSIRHMDGVMLYDSSPPRRLSIAQNVGFIFVESNEGRGGSGIIWVHERGSASIPFPLHMPAWQTVDGNISTSFLAHWFLILLFFIPWTAFLLWRGRRLKRLVVNIEHRTPGSER